MRDCPVRGNTIFLAYKFYPENIMKKILGLLVILSFLLSSCSFLGDSFSRQKYTGFKRGGGDATLLHQKREHPSLPAGKEIIETYECCTIPSTGIVPGLEPFVVEAPHKSKTEETPVIRKDQKPAALKLMGKSGSTGKGSLPDVVMILLCIFIPWLAILLIEQTTLRFWIALICWLLAFSYFAFGPLGLFWLIAVILAFMAYLG